MTSYNPNNPSCAAWFRALSGGGSLACAIGLEQFSPHGGLKPAVGENCSNPIAPALSMHQELGDIQSQYGFVHICAAIDSR